MALLVLTTRRQSWYIMYVHNSLLQKFYLPYVSAQGFRSLQLFCNKDIFCLYYIHLLHYNKSHFLSGNKEISVTSSLLQQ